MTTRESGVHPKSHLQKFTLNKIFTSIIKKSHDSCIYLSLENKSCTYTECTKNLIFNELIQQNMCQIIKFLILCSTTYLKNAYRERGLIAIWLILIKKSVLLARGINYCLFNSERKLCFFYLSSRLCEHNSGNMLPYREQLQYTFTLPVITFSRCFYSQKWN